MTTIIPVNIVNHATPALSVIVQDSGVPAVTYNQIKQSLGSQVYRVDRLYMYSTNMNQLLSVLQYQIFDAGGNQGINSIATTIDPYAGNGTAIDVDLTKYQQDFIFNGNSSLATKILPLTSVQLKLYTSRLTNTFGANINSFKQMEELANKPDFYNNYGNTTPDVIATNKAIENTASAPTGKGSDVAITSTQEPFPWIAVVMIAGGTYLIIKK